MLRGGIQQPLARGILTHRVDVRIGANPVHDFRPRPAIVRGLPDIGRAIAEQRAPHRHIGRGIAERRRIDLADAAEIRHVLRGHVRPRLSGVAGDVHQTVVAARPDGAHRLLARADREDHAVYLRAVHVAGDGAARRTLGLRIVAREITAQRGPRAASVRGAPQPLRRHIQRMRIDRGEDDGIRPLPPLLDVPARFARVEPGIRIHFARRVRAAIELVEIPAVVRPRVELVGVERIGPDVTGLASAGHVRHRHTAQRDVVRAERRGVAAGAGATTSAAPAPAAGAQPEGGGVPVERRAERAVVLLRAADVIRDVPGGRDVIELLRRKVLRRPRAARVGGHRATAVVTDHEMRRVTRIDPQIVHVPVRAAAHVHQ